MGPLVQAIQQYEPLVNTFNSEHPLLKDFKQAKGAFKAAFLIFSLLQDQSQLIEFNSTLKGKAFNKADDWCRPKFDEKRIELDGQTVSEDEVRAASVKFIETRKALNDNEDWNALRELRKTIRNLAIPLLKLNSPDQMSSELKSSGLSDAIIATVVTDAVKYGKKASKN